MPEIQNVEESDGEEDENIPADLPGGKSWIPPRRNRPAAISYSKPERIDINGGESIPRKRGRPAGSGRKPRSDTTKIEGFWIVGFALGLNIGTAYLARGMNDAKYIMRKPEAEAAARGVVTVLWQYKQFRDFALIVNTDSPWAILAKGFWPYINRVFAEEVIKSVVSGLFVRQSGPGKSGQPIAARPVGHADKSNGGNDGSIGTDGFPNITVAPGVADWRAL